jgi:predicted dehydrogenase
MSQTIARLGRRLRLGVVGGGPGSFIGEVHRTAARLDDHFEVVAGVLSRDPERSRRAAATLGLDPARVYADVGTLLDQEAARPAGIDALAVMTPNGAHYQACRAALERGLDLICDKPLTTRLGDALDLVQRVRASGLVFCLTHNYSA